MTNGIHITITRSGLVQRVNCHGHGKTLSAVTKENDGWYATAGGSLRIGPFEKRADAVATIA